MKLNDIVTWTGRNGEKRFGLIVAPDGNKYRVMRWCQWARAAGNAHFLFQGDKPNDSEVRAICSPKRLGKQEK